MDLEISGTFGQEFILIGILNVDLAY